MTGRKIVIVGAGKVALQKVKPLLLEEVQICIVAPEIHPGLWQCQEQNNCAKIEIRQKAYEANDLSEADFVFICTNDHKINQQVLQDIQPQQLVNDCTNPKNSDFYNMAIVQQAEVVIAVSSQGKNPKKTKYLKEKLAQYLKHFS